MDIVNDGIVRSFAEGQADLLLKSGHVQVSVSFSAVDRVRGVVGT